jgi:16S rRNA (adenine1518-N6/adenine1519-N6)-dimethyltransferase
MTRQEIIRLLKKTGLQPQKAAGQHFLLDETVVERMVDAAGVGSDDTILEIGPGLGILTELLLARGAHVVAVELDRRLFAYLQQHFAGRRNLELVAGDIFKINLNKYLTDRKYKLVANLPYSATSMVFRQFLNQPPRPASMHVLIQAEVADRIIAEPGQMSLLALAVQLHGQPKKMFIVPRTSFYPAPEVTSAVLGIDQCTASDAAVEETIFRLARIAFAGKRKQLHNSLASGLKRNVKEIEEKLLKLGIPPEIRPQELSIDNWLTLAKSIK